MKKLVSILFAFVFIFCLNLNVIAQTSEELKENATLCIEDSFDIVTYDYLTGTETSNTLYAKDNTVQKEYAKTKLQTESTKAVLDAETFSMSAPAYFPEDTEAIENPITPQTIFGTDTRKKVDPKTNPYCAVMCLIGCWDTNGDGKLDTWTLGTGFMVGSKALVTAAHNYWKLDGGWVKECRTYKYQNSTALNATFYYPASWVCPANYTKSLDKNYDWCVVTMQNRIGDSGYFGYVTGAPLLNRVFSIAGYPVDHKYYQYVSLGVVKSENTFSCTYDIDMTFGQSGSPVYDGSYRAWAINTYQATTYNQGNKITAWCYDLITQARAK